MDLSVNQEVMRVHQRYEAEYGNHVFTLQDTYKETDITGNNNFFNSLKTEMSSDHTQDPTSLFQVNCSDEKDFKVDNSLFSYSSFKKAMDLRIHNRTVDGGKRTIFDDAEYFARNCCYKLLPITFEQVDEMIIHTEHNYSLCSLDSESETEEDCSRTMDYSQIREKNYKKRKTKCPESSDQEEVVICEKCQDDSDPPVEFAQHSQDEEFSPSLEQENPYAGQPLDLSAAPVVQEEKTEPLSSASEENGQPDSDKENVSAELSGIRVTITRPDEKENYQPCDLFLNDIARLVPWLIDKDCFEVDILDRTCDHHDEFRKHRLYYVIAESTWRFFQSTNERVILTNDRSLGQPLREAEKNERPSYLVFDQLSLAKSLAEYCQEIGGCFEYTCLEEEASKECLEEKKGLALEADKVGMEARKAVELEEERMNSVEGLEGDADERGNKRQKQEEGEGEDGNEVTETKEEQVEEKKEEVTEKKDKEETTTEKVEMNEIATGKEEKKEICEKECENEVFEEGKKEKEEEDRRRTKGERQEDKKEATKTVRNVINRNPAGVDGGKKSKEESKVGISRVLRKSKPSKETLKVSRLTRKESGSEVKDLNETEQSAPASKKGSKANEKIARTRKSKQKRETLIQAEPKNSQIVTRSKSTSEFETSQKSDNRVSRKERRRCRDPTPPKEEPPKKRKRMPTSQEVSRNGRSATLPRRTKVTPKETATWKRPEQKKETNRKSGKTKAKQKKVNERKNMQTTGRSLRSGANEKGMPPPLRKTRKR